MLLWWEEHLLLRLHRKLNRLRSQISWTIEGDKFAWQTVYLVVRSSEWRNISKHFILILTSVVRPKCDELLFASSPPRSAKDYSVKLANFALIQNGKHISNVIALKYAIRGPHCSCSINPIVCIVWILLNEWLTGK
jgi:hypothetical protein